MYSDHVGIGCDPWVMDNWSVYVDILNHAQNGEYLETHFRNWKQDVAFLASNLHMKQVL